MQKYVEWNGRMLPVSGTKRVGDMDIQVIEVDLMTDIRWQRMALLMRLKPEGPLQRERLREIDGDTDAAIARLEAWLKENDPDYEEWRKNL